MFSGKRTGVRSYGVGLLNLLGRGGFCTISGKLLVLRKVRFHQRLPQKHRGKPPQLDPCCYGHADLDINSVPSLSNYLILARSLYGYPRMAAGLSTLFGQPGARNHNTASPPES